MSKELIRRRIYKACEWGNLTTEKADEIFSFVERVCDECHISKQNTDLQAEVERLEKENKRLGSWDTPKSDFVADIVADIEEFLKDISRENDKPKPWVFTPGEKEVLDQYLLTERDELRAEVAQLREAADLNQLAHKRGVELHQQTANNLKAAEAKLGAVREALWDWAHRWQLNPDAIAELDSDVLAFEAATDPGRRG